MIETTIKPWLEIPGATTEEELDWLHEQAKGKKLIYEIGSFLGRSTVALLESGSKVIACDDFYGARDEKCWTEKDREQFYHKFLNNTRDYKNLTVVRCDHKIFQPIECDMVFIDGSHYYDDVVRDILKFAYMKDILICGHDYKWWNSVREAVNKLFRGKFQLATDNLWYVRQ